jgi:PAS domain S-box-containing protein
MSTTNPLTVLVVDDSDFFAEMTASTLADEHGMETTWATHAEGALDALADQEFDCIVSDYDMPDTDGLELKALVEERYGGVPFIILTGRGDESVAARAISAGVADYILKLEVVEDQQYQRLANRIESAVSERRAQKRYELLVENTPDAVAQVTADGEILAANPAMAALADADRERLVGTDIADALPEIGDRLLSVGCQTVADGETRREEVEVGEQYFQSIFVQVDINTERDTFQLIARDVTERTERERELQRQNERLDQFASMVSHDLRNPLDIAQVNLSLLADEFETEPPEIEKISDSHRRMADLIDDLLTLAKQGATIEATEPTDVAAAAEDVWPYVNAPDTDLVLATDGRIDADPSRLQEMLTNLFQNAVDHGDADTIRVETTTDGFAVADDGSGIPPADREEVFRTGFSTDDDGTGFGLAIVSEIADAHGWSISVAESRDGIADEEDESAAPRGGRLGGARFEVTDVDLA